MDLSREELRRLLFSLLSDEELEAIKRGHKVENQRKKQVFEATLERLFLKAMDQGLRVRASRYYPFPLSGAISVSGKEIKVEEFEDIIELAKEESIVELEIYDEEAILEFTFNGMI